MMLRCEKCHRYYDDAEDWTICPHNPLYQRSDAVLCTYHDLFDCRICGDALAEEKARKKRIVIMWTFGIGGIVLWALMFWGGMVFFTWLKTK